MTAQGRTGSRSWTGTSTLPTVAVSMVSTPSSRLPAHGTNTNSLALYSARQKVGVPWERIRPQAAWLSAGVGARPKASAKARSAWRAGSGPASALSRSREEGRLLEDEPAVEEVEGLEGRGGDVAARGDEGRVGAVEGAEGRVLLAPRLELVDHPAEGVGAELGRGAGRPRRSWCSSPRCCSRGRPSPSSSLPLQARIASRIDSVSSRRGVIRQSRRFWPSTARARSSSRLDWR